jgi:hypothetical protein
VQNHPPVQAPALALVLQLAPALTLVQVDQLTLKLFHIKSQSNSVVIHILCFHYFPLYLFLSPLSLFSHQYMLIYFIISVLYHSFMLCLFGCFALFA